MEPNHTDSEEETAPADLPRLVGRRRKKKGLRLSNRSKKTRPNVANITKKSMQKNPALAEKVQRIREEASQFEEEKKEDDEIEIEWRRNPKHSSTQNAQIILVDDASEDERFLEEMVVNVHYYERVARSDLDDVVVIPTDKMGCRVVSHETRRSR